MRKSLQMARAACARNTQCKGGGWRANCVLPGVINAISIDVEDYFHTECMAPYAPRYTWDSLPCHIERNTRRLFEIFDEQAVKATFFFLGWVAERFPALVREAVARGHEIGCHSHMHHPVYRLSPMEFREDTRRAKHVIEEAGGVAVDCYRAPSFSIVPRSYWAFDVLGELGFTRDSSVNPVPHPTYGNPTAPRVPWMTEAGVVEFPIATWRVFGRNLPAGGGAYLRILPYEIVRRGVAAMNREGLPANIYLHPWEIDAEQPRIATKRVARMRQYTGLARMEAKLRRLLSDFRFSSLGVAFAATTPESLPRVAAQTRAA